MNTEQPETLAARIQQTAPDVVDRFRWCLDQFADKNLNLDQVIDRLRTLVLDWLIGLKLDSEHPFFSYIAAWLGDEFCEKVLGKKPILHRDISQLTEDMFFSEDREEMCLPRPPRFWIDPGLLAVHQALIALRYGRGGESRYSRVGSVIFDELDAQFGDKINPIE